ncbi:TSR3 protein, partial [Acromyrmex charruanus]
MSGRRKKDKNKLLQRRPRNVLCKELRYHQKRDRMSDCSDSSDKENDETETVNEWPLPFPVAMWDLEHCSNSNSKQSKHGTGKKLVRYGLTKLLRLSTRFSGLCLTPVSDKCVTPLDRKIVEKYGCAVVNCSWSRIDDTPFNKVRTSHPRILPFLVSANSTKPCELSCAEAIAATLIITGFPDEADLILDKFSWGHLFLELNSELLEKYARCANTEEVIAVQEKFLKDIQQEKIDRLALSDFPPSDTESEEEAEEKDKSVVSEITRELANARI